MSTGTALVDAYHACGTNENGESFHLAPFGYPTVRADNVMVD